jgi:biotin carboxyl carrier protein
MKTEITVTAKLSGRVQALRVAQGDSVTPGQTLLVIART